MQTMSNTDTADYYQSGTAYLGVNLSAMISQTVHLTVAKNVAYQTLSTHKNTTEEMTVRHRRSAQKQHH